MSNINLITDKEIDNIDGATEDNNAHLLDNIEYICKSTKLITDSLRNGCDVAQFPNGDVMITETKVVHMHYSWDADKKKMVRLS